MPDRDAMTRAIADVIDAGAMSATGIYKLVTALGAEVAGDMGRLRAA